MSYTNQRVQLKHTQKDWVTDAVPWHINMVTLALDPQCISWTSYTDLQHTLIFFIRSVCCSHSDFMVRLHGSMSETTLSCSHVIRVHFLVGHVCSLSIHPPFLSHTQIHLSWRGNRMEMQVMNFDSHHWIMWVFFPFSFLLLPLPLYICLLTPKPLL